MKRNGWTRTTAMLLALLLGAGRARAERVGTLTTILGAEPVRVEGMGIVSGLNGTGDKSAAVIKQLRTYLENHDYNPSLADLSSKNVALVWVDAEVPADTRPGQSLDVRVTSANDAQSLEGGVLRKCFLRSRPDGPIVTVASGRVMVGGRSAEAMSPTSGHIPGGGQAIDVGELGAQYIGPDNTFVLNLRRRSFTDAAAIARAINTDEGTNPYLQARIGFGSFNVQQTQRVARALDAGSILVTIPEGMRDRKVEYIAEVKNLDVPVSRPARVLVNRQTNTVIITGEVRVDPVAISHRNLAVRLPALDQAAPGQPDTGYALQAGDDRRVAELDGPGQLGNLQNLIDTLNAMGVRTEDVIVIVQKLKSSGALHAELIVE